MKNKVIENYSKICEFLLSKAATTPIETQMDVDISQFVGHYASIEIEHKPNRKAYVRMYDCPDVRGHSPQNYFYDGYDIKEICAAICKDRPTEDFMRNLVVGWHRYGIKTLILNNLSSAVAKANEKLEAEKEINNFTV